ncbi:MAG: hypothetical protein VX278_03335 [Myxococcota bacterium]|nr:hypothetical protein [Myxococcota bacterium]
MENLPFFSSVEREVQALRTEAGLIWKPETTSVTLYGDDVRRWCNGMFSNNIRKLRPGYGNRSAICSHKGHVQGLLDIYCISNTEFLLVLDGISFDFFLERFERYMILDDIEYKDDTTGLLFSIQGPQTAAALEKAGIALPEGEENLHITDNYTILKKDRLGGGFDIISEQSPILWEKIQQAGAVPIGTQAQEIERILQKKPAWPTDAQRISFIHDLLLNEECCAFDKGCYVGQEIINRMDVKGLANKRLTLFSFSTSVPVGTTLEYQSKKVGTISSTCQLSDRFYGLAVIRKAGWDQTLTYKDGLATPIDETEI